jgi:hypothetical protein
MLVVRLLIFIAFIGIVVLAAAFFTTRNKIYLQYIKQILNYAGWLLLTLLLFYFILRVLHL